MQQTYYWQKKSPEPPAADVQQALTKVTEGSGMVAQMLANRGLTSAETAHQFLHPEDMAPRPATDLPHLEKGLARMAYAVQNNEPILIYGDFDVDGVTGTSILYDTLKHQLNANVTYYIPHRAHEGHGLNVSALLKLVSARQVKVVITTDTGISSFNEVSLLNSFNVDTIITDHHELPEHLPPSLANINPKLLDDPKHPQFQLSGAGVAFLFCKALLEECQPDNPELSKNLERLSVLAAIGLIADVVPLIDDNRYWVRKGLAVLNRRKEGIIPVGIQAILDAAGVADDATVTSQTIGFVIGPRINAIGRLDHAADAVELLTTTDSTKAATIASRLEQLNRQRQTMCEQTMVEAETHLRQTGGLDGRRAIVLGSPDWHPGIIGIVASRLVEKYRVPTFLLHIDNDKNEARGSARSIPGFALHEAIESVRHIITHGGGHSAAAGCGMPLDKLNAFKNAIYQYAAERITDAQMIPSLTIEASLEWSQVNTHLVELVSRLEPYGAGNPSPLFEVGPVQIGAQRTMGSNGQHKKLVLTPNGKTGPVDAIIWNANTSNTFEKKTAYHFVVEPQLNTFNGKTSVQLMVRDVAFATHINQNLSVPDRSDKKAEATSAPASTTQVAQPAPAVMSPAKASTTESIGPIWIDHRQRPSLENFIQQFLLPLSQQPKTTSDSSTQPRSSFLIYHEGSRPQLPLVRPEHLVTRYQVSPVHELLFWDIPPDLPTLKLVLQQTQPAMVHWVAGKYQKVSPQPTTDNFLKGVAKLLTQRLSQPGALPIDTSLNTLMTYFATTETALMNTLALLQQAKHFQVELSGEQAVNIQLPADAISTNLEALTAQVASLANTLEYRALTSALQSIGQFRQQMLTAPLDQIQSSAIVTAGETAPLPVS